MPLDPFLAAQVPLIAPLAPGLFIPHKRSIGGIVARVTVEELERDEVVVTRHPVEQGAPTSDHAFKEQAEVVVRAGWNLQDGDLSAETGVYGLILYWQASFQIFDLVTGKRIHRNMLMTSVVSTTDSASEYALLLTIACRELILTKTQTTTFNNTAPSYSSNGEAINRGAQQTPQIADSDRVADLIDEKL